MERTYVYIGDNNGLMKIWELTEIIKDYLPVISHIDSLRSFMPFRHTDVNVGGYLDDSL